MNFLLQHLTSPEWTHVVKALLHTLWQATIVAALLGLRLRRLANPAARYRCALAALAIVAGANLLTWGVLNRPDAATATAVAPITSPQIQNPSPQPVSRVIVVAATRNEVKPPVAAWTAWVALAWIAGAMAMLFRAGIQVAGAEKVRRSTRPLDDPRIAQLVVEARRAMRLTRKIRVAATDKLTSPAVVGVLVPTLILPLSLISTFTPDQLRFVLLHELAHIRRGDYFANLFQLFTEALLFFNPAVWWISHQIRREREACCDALAVELSNAPADYARTLLKVAENILESMPAVATSFGDTREPSSLAERVERMLVPGYRPSLRLTWRAMFAALFVGGILLVLSAIGTRLTVAAILSPQQRIEQIEKKMAEYGEKPEETISSKEAEKLPKVKISGQVRMMDGSKLPKNTWLNIYTHRKHVGSVSSARANPDGTYSTSVMPSQVYVGLDVPGFAPAVAGPVDATATNLVENLDIVLDRGFAVAIEVADADTKKQVSGALIKWQFWVKEGGFGIGKPSELKTDTAGTAKLSHCSDSVTLTLVVNAPGYEIAEQKIKKLTPQETIQVTLWRGAGLSGVVLKKADNSPIEGATVRMLYEKGRTDAHYGWTDPMRVLAKTDASGEFAVNQLRRGAVYWLGVSAPGHESVIAGPLQAGIKNMSVSLGPELIVRGRVTGSLEGLHIIDKAYCLSRNYAEVFENNSYGSQAWVPIRVEDGVATFQFTNPIPGRVTLSGNQGFREERDVTAPVNDWVVNLSDARKLAAQQPKREVIFRFQHPSGVPPRGTVSVSVPDSLDPNHLTAHIEEKEIVNGEARVEIAIGGRTYVEPKRMVGYWFKQDYSGIIVTNGAGPLVVDVPVVPAGAIYAQARNADDDLAGGLFFNVRELKRAPTRDASSPLDSGSDSVSGNAPRKWVSGPLPLGGTYQIIGWRGNSFCASQPITLTEANPDAEVMLQFPASRSFEGRVLNADGQPVRDAQLKTSFNLPDNHSFGLNKVFTDATGLFRIEDATQEIGDYSVEAVVPGFMAERVKLDFSTQPQVIRLKRGHTLGGRVVQAGTGWPIPGMEIRALDYSTSKMPMLTTHTDADGRFEFTSLGDAEYTLYPDGGELLGRPARGNRTFRADGNTNLTLEVKLYEWSKLKPNASAAASAREPHSSMRNTFGADDVSVGLFSALPKSPLQASNRHDLFTRTFRLDTNSFYRALQKASLFPLNQTNAASAMRDFFSSLGVNITESGKSVFYSEGKGLLLVRATKQDLDTIESAIAQINPTPPQINIKAKFVEVPAKDAERLLQMVFTNTPTGGSNGFTGILTEPQADRMLKTVKSLDNVDLLNAPEMTTVSGRQAQIQIVDVQTVVTGLDAVVTNGLTNLLPRTDAMRFGSVLDVIPYVSADGYTIQLTLIPSVTEFLGYDDPGTLLPVETPVVPKSTGQVAATTAAADLPSSSQTRQPVAYSTPALPLPRTRVRQITATAIVWDGQTIVLGNFPVKEVSTQPDGAAIEMDTTAKYQKQLLVFVTPTLVDQAGNRMHAEEEMPFARERVPPQKAAK